MSRCTEMELTRFDITPTLRQALEPLILDALLEYALRHRSGNGDDGAEPVLHLNLTQAMDVVTAQEARWRPRIEAAAKAAKLELDATSVPRRAGTHLNDMLRRAQAFFRREGAATLQTAVATAGTPGGRFSMLWTDYFSRCLLDWLREHDLIGRADDYLELADSLVESAKLWVRELSVLTGDEGMEFTDAEREISTTLERGPVRLRLRGKLEPKVLHHVKDGLELVDFRFGDPERLSQQVAHLVLHQMLVEKLRDQPCPSARLVFVSAKRVPTAPSVVPDEVEQAFAPFVGNEPVAQRLKEKAARSVTGMGTSAGVENLLITGAVGHGKTLLVRCYARALDLPVIQLHTAGLGNAEDFIDALNDQLLDQDLRPGLAKDSEERLVLTYPPIVLFLDDLHGSRRKHEPWHDLLNAGRRRLETGARVASLTHAVMIAATQDAALLPDSVAAQFRRVDLEPYRHEDVARMVSAVFEAQRLTLPPALAHLIAVMGRCNPMRARLFASELRDRHRSNPVKTPLTREALLHLASHHWQVDDHGLSSRDYQYLQALEAGPRGLPALQQLLPMKDEELTVHIEPYLLQIGAIRRNSRGRSITVLGEQLLQRNRARKRK